MASSRGHIEFDDLTEDEFIDLVKETLETSEFIETEWFDAGGAVNEDVLVIKEVQD